MFDARVAGSYVCCACVCAWYGVFTTITVRSAGDERFELALVVLRAAIAAGMVILLFSYVYFS